MLPSWSILYHPSEGAACTNVTTDPLGITWITELVVAGPVRKFRSDVVFSGAPTKSVLVSAASSVVASSGAPTSSAESTSSPSPDSGAQAPSATIDPAARAPARRTNRYERWVRYV